MKKCKKILAVLLSLTMLMTLCLSVVADEVTTESSSTPAAETSSVGSITINGAVADQTYHVYRVLDLTYNSADKAYNYTANADWETFVNTQTTYFTVLPSGAVKAATQAPADIEKLAKVALQYAKDNPAAIQSVASITVSTDENGNVIIPEDGSITVADKDGNAITPVDGKITVKTDDVITAKISNLELGYYLIDSSLGALCGLDTTDTNAQINEKNGVPTVTKLVTENSSSQQGTTNDANIGDTITYTTTIVTSDGAENYILHDSLDEGLTLNVSSLNAASIVFNSAAIAALDLADTPAAASIVEDNYTILFSNETDDGCDFHIVFNNEWLDTVAPNSTITITYTATLNSKAKIGMDTEGNKNKTWLTYGDTTNTKNKTAISAATTTTTYTHKQGLIKVNSNNIQLENAIFKLYDGQTSENAIQFVKYAGTDGLDHYRRADAEEIKAYNDAQAAEGTTPENVPNIVTEITAGNVIFEGIDSSAYYLEEVQAPDGYNRIKGRQTISVSATTDSLVTTTTTGDGKTAWVSGYKVENLTGTEFPSTGGIGTTIFYIIGGLLVLMAVVLLVVRRRMTSENNK